MSPAAAVLPVAVIGAGPVGLAAAAHLLMRNETPLVLEAGDSVGASVRRWGHVRLFSPWRYLVDEAAAQLLKESGWKQPELERLPTGHELVTNYLAPLAQHPRLEPLLRLATRVLSVARQRHDKMKTAGRDHAPFVLTVRDAEGNEERLLARAVIDASGTYETPNSLGAEGMPALGEVAAASRLFYGIPDVLGSTRTRYEGKRVLVVGAGHSALNALLDLAELARQAPTTQVTWAVRRERADRRLFGGADLDGLPARGALGGRARQLVDTNAVRLLLSFHAETLHTSPEGLTVTSGAVRAGPFDEVVVATGFRPHLEPFRELRLHLDPGVEAPAALAPLIDPNLHSCGSVPPHGAADLAHPEKDFYIVGMKSYGRAPTFLALTGYEQVRSVVCALTGDHEGARAVRLVVPETGVCSTDFAEPDVREAAPATKGCCA
ncbi:flavoprotein [Corallococcus sp. H22C18031201]|nr:flavoprotein [Corallococcus sp. H22C18031201]